MNIKIHRILLSVLVMIFTLCAAERVACEEKKPVKILLQWMPQAQFAGYIMAQEKGFFAEEGLPSVQLLWAQQGESPLRRLAKGEVDLATGWLISGLQRKAEGEPIVHVAQFMQQSGTMIIARKDKNIHSVHELNGKTILAWGGDFGIEFDMFLKINNITPGKVYPLSTSLSPFLHGLVDAMQAMEYSEYQRILERGMKPEEVVIFPLAEHKVHFAGDGLYTNTTFLAEHKDTVKAVRRAVEKGWVYAFAHEEETITAVLKEAFAWNSGSNSAYQLQMLRIIRTLMERPGVNMGDLPRESFEAMRATSIEFGLPLHSETYESFHATP